MIYFIILLAIFILGAIQISEIRKLNHMTARILMEIEQLKKPASRKEY